jgi:hypothetical protein
LNCRAQARARLGGGFGGYSLCPLSSGRRHQRGHKSTHKHRASGYAETYATGYIPGDPGNPKAYAAKALSRFSASMRRIAFFVGRAGAI